MKTKIDLSFFFDGSMGFDLRLSQQYKKNMQKCIKASQQLMTEVQNNSNEIINSFSISYQNKIKKLRDQIKTDKQILVIGLGGSSAGAKAINGYLKKNIYFLDNYDPGHLSNFFKNNNLNDFTIYVISKSGNTYETLAMLNLIYQYMLKISNKNFIKKKFIIIVENTNNFLNNFAKKVGCKIVEHNPKIGGRYSVFSETGMLLFNLKPKLISQATNAVISKLKQKNTNDHCSPIVNAALILTLQQKSKIKFNINLLYEYSLKNYSYWFHQLFAESLGKNQNAITPMTSICPKDHHSMMQLFIDGPRDKLFNIYAPTTSNDFKKFSSLNLGNIEDKSPNSLLQAQFQGLLKTFKHLKIPFRVITCSNLQKDKALNILELLAYNIIETIILGYAQNLNPYDQPAVEQIKINTFNF